MFALPLRILIEEQHAKIERHQKVQQECSEHTEVKHAKRSITRW